MNWQSFFSTHLIIIVSYLWARAVAEKKLHTFLLYPRGDSVARTRHHIIRLRLAKKMTETIPEMLLVCSGAALFCFLHLYYKGISERCPVRPPRNVYTRIVPRACIVFFLFAVLLIPPPPTPYQDSFIFLKARCSSRWLARPEISPLPRYFSAPARAENALRP